MNVTSRRRFCSKALALYNNVASASCESNLYLNGGGRKSSRGRALLMNDYMCAACAFAAGGIAMFAHQARRCGGVGGSQLGRVIRCGDASVGVRCTVAQECGPGPPAANDRPLGTIFLTHRALPAVPSGLNHCVTSVES